MAVISGLPLQYTKRQMIGEYASGDFRPIAVCNSGEVIICSGLFVTANMIGLSLSGLDIQVNISGDPVIISGQPVTISGDHVFVESGVHVIADINVEVSSGLWVDGVSGVHVYQESGAFVTAYGNLGISGTVTVESGLGVLISGQPVTISGDHVFVESGVYFASGLCVAISGQHVYTEPACSSVGPACQLIGNVATQLPANPVESVAVKNLGCIRTANLSGTFVPFSGNVIWAGHNTVNSGIGMLMNSGEVITMDVDNINKIWAWAETSGTQVALLGVKNCG